jgi:hypothetical protein
MATAFSMMSSRRCAGLSEGNGAIPVDLSLKALLAGRLFDDVHLSSQNVFQPPFEFGQAAEVVQSRFGKVIAQTDGYVDIVCRRLATRDRAEQRCTYDAGVVQLPFVRF